MITAKFDPYSKKYFLRQGDTLLAALSKEDMIKSAMEMLKLAGVPNV